MNNYKGTQFVRIWIVILGFKAKEFCSKVQAKDFGFKTKVKDLGLKTKANVKAEAKK